MTQDNDPEADFWLHVGNAQASIEEFNNFDPNGTDEGRAKLMKIAGECNEAAVTLIEYIAEHKDQLLEKLKGAE
jgi:hypothetical protein